MCWPSDVARPVEWWRRNSRTSTAVRSRLVPNSATSGARNSGRQMFAAFGARLPPPRAEMFARAAPLVDLYRQWRRWWLRSLFTLRADDREATGRECADLPLRCADDRMRWVVRSGGDEIAVPYRCEADRDVRLIPCTPRLHYPPEMNAPDHPADPKDEPSPAFQSAGGHVHKPRHALVLPPEERGRRIRWRIAVMGVYAALQAVALQCAHQWNWPEGFTIPAVAIPYWYIATAVWSQWGPEMPGMH
jgi:hypothetical protein